MTAALVTPWVAARIGRRRWIVVVMVEVAITQFGFGAPFTIVPILFSSFALGFTNQVTKVCVDTLVQAGVDDEFRGRVFSFYDTSFNLSFVGGAFVAAFVLPGDGKSLGVLAAMSVGYLAIAAGYTAAEHLQGRRSAPQHAAEQSA